MNKKLAMLAIVSICNLYYGQHVDKNILKSTNIAQIEEYLKNIHPDDPKKNILKRRIVELKNIVWTQGAKDVKPMAPRSLEPAVINDNSEELEEFKNLITLSPEKHKAHTVQLLNTLFNDDIHVQEAILLVKNYSSCDMIIRIQGNEKYNLPVSANNENTLIIKKGDYTLSGNMCGSKYSSQKKITKSMIVDLRATPSIGAKNISSK